MELIAVDVSGAAGLTAGGRRRAARALGVADAFGCGLVIGCSASHVHLSVAGQARPLCPNHRHRDRRAWSQPQLVDLATRPMCSGCRRAALWLRRRGLLQ